VLHLLASPWWSGPAENVALLALAQAEAGCEVSVAVDRRRTHAPAEEPAVPRLEALGLLEGAAGLALSVKSPPWEVLQDAWRLRGARGVDVVHAHFSHDHLLARLGRPRDARGRPAVLVRSLHAPRSLRRLLPHADAYTVPSEELRARLPGRRVAVLPPLVDPRFTPAPDRAGLRRALGLPPGASPLVGMVSTFQPSRRHALGVAAFAQLRAARPAAHLVLVGDGALLPQVRAQVEALGLGAAVTFAGYQGAGAFVPWLQALDEVWVLGLGNDWSGRAAAQARACGVRVVAVREGALPQLADALVEARVEAPTPEAVLAASLSGGRGAAAHPGNAEVARGVLALYREAGARG
jgi:glycosyltransferase involved in cell wall biosynthesis